MFDYFICHHLESGRHVTRPNQGLSLGRGNSLGTRLFVTLKSWKTLKLCYQKNKTTVDLIPVVAMAFVVGVVEGVAWADTQKPNSAVSQIQLISASPDVTKRYKTTDGEQYRTASWLCLLVSFSQTIYNIFMLFVTQCSTKSVSITGAVVKIRCTVFFRIIDCVAGDLVRRRKFLSFWRKRLYYFKILLNN